MLTPNPNQYLRPEYLSPLPTTLDAKKSPLALLAQTCSNIGMDSPNNKPLISPMDKKKEKKSDGLTLGNLGSSSASSSSSTSDDKPSFKPYETTKKSPTPPKDEDKRSTPSSHRSPRTSPAVSEKSDKGKSTPPKSDAIITSASMSSSTVTTSSTATSASTTLSSLGYGLDLTRDPTSKEGLAALSHLSMAYKGLNHLSCSPLAGHMPPLDPTHPFAKGLSYPGLSPYVGYARVKTPTGGTSLVPVCRDPFCTNCQLSMQSAQLAPCPSGCTQCTHERVVPPALPLIPGLHSPSGLFNPLAGRPNVCSWMVGDTYCGKRFNSSEDLLQHLRTHTSLAGGDSGLPSQLLSPSALSFSAVSTSPSLTTSSLRRSYPAPSISPISSSRYHPYKSSPVSSSTTPGTPTLPAFPTTPFAPLPHPSLSMFYSPYALYGQRLGPPVHP